MALRYSQTLPAVVLLILAIVGILLVVLPAKNVETPPEYMYGIVLDAGSSHTSMYIYKWPADKQNGTGIVTQHSECNVQGGGISSYAGDRGGAAESLKACLEQAVKVIPKSRHHQTPLQLGATAGMRLLNIVNATETQRLLKEVENKLRSYPFKFKEAIILSGQEEGAYGWVTVNYLLENFVKTEGVKPQVSNPCYPHQFNISIKLGKDVFDSPCTKSYRPSQFNPQMSVSVVGTGDYQKCLDNVKEILTFDNCSYSKCSFNGVFQPNVRGSFMAFSAFFFAHSYITNLTSIPLTSPSRLEKAIRIICNLTISEMTKRTNQKEKHMKNVCAVSNFIQVLLVQGYKFNETSLPSISFQKKAGGASVGWALGYMLTRSNLVPAEGLGQMKALALGPWAGILFLFIAILLIALGYLIMIYRHTQNKEGMV
ncbi:ectonucleoside triphosphate diphosphohydrolase 2-like isoform X2 [Etheostoma cragini]|uniref:ectonucleoside triphosphate diphosphohydrolase 2-like isoform X2 n=1 Tax=Etheostoma cragini TaxID=417921 RepID=UPI00155ECEB3|nr:ectonucleoside triphosphate diphosphohydrolase 2-like isoform X2 [Etheostoma cragini]